MQRLPWLARDKLQNPNDPAAYRALIARHAPAPGPAERAAIAAHIAALPARPVISLVMPAAGASAAEVLAAIEVLRGQL